MTRPIARRVFPWALVVCLAGMGWSPAPAAAASLEKLDCSIQWVPADAAYYNVMLRNREQVEAILNSRAWEKLVNMPVVKMGLAEWEKQAGRPGTFPAQVMQALKDPEVRELIDLGIDMVSDEVFVYADKDWLGFIDLSTETLGAVQFGPLYMLMSGKAFGADADEMQLAMVLTTLTQNLDLIKVPHTIIGFKLTDTDRAKRQLAKLEALATRAFESEPILRGRCKRQTVAGNEYLTFTFDGKMIPWNEVPLARMERLLPNPGDLDKLVDRLKNLKLVAAIGLRGDYLLVSIGGSLEPLAALGEGTPLVERPEMARLEAHADQRITSISYTSKGLKARTSTTQEDIDELREAAKSWLPMAKLKGGLEDRIAGDIDRLADDLKKFVPEPGASVSVTFLSDEGIESYGYDWTENLSLDGSKPLTLLDHLGGTPIAVLVSRSKVSAEGYDFLVKWIKIGYGYFEDLAVPQMPESAQEEYRTFTELFFPLFKRLDVATREKLLPALADGQAALVLDAKLESRQFIKALPATEEPMPMIEPAIVFGVSDADLLREAVSEYYSVVSDALKAIRTLWPDSPLDFEIPKPKVAKTDVGTIYGYPLPSDWGVDRRIMPNAGLSDHVCALSISRWHTKRLLTSTPLEDGGLLTTDRPLAAAGYLNWAALVDAATPWAELAARAIAADAMHLPGGIHSDDPQMEFVLGQVRTALEVLGTVRTVSSVTYFDDEGVKVTHSLMVVRDVD